MSRKLRKVTPMGAFLARHPIEVQGLAIRPGDEVLVVLGDRTFPHVYAGEHEGRYWTGADLTTAPGQGPGPYKLEDFRHPDILTGLAKRLTEEG